MTEKRERGKGRKEGETGKGVGGEREEGKKESQSQGYRDKFILE